MRSILVGAMALFGMTTAVDAAILIGGPIYGSPQQSVVACNVFNAGTTSITISKVQIFAESSSTALTLSGNDCLAAGALPGVLPVAGTCRGFVLGVFNSSLHSCRVTLSSKTNVSGSLEIRTSSQITLNSVPLK